MKKINLLFALALLFTFNSKSQTEIYNQHQYTELTNSIKSVKDLKKLLSEEGCFYPGFCVEIGNYRNSNYILSTNNSQEKYPLNNLIDTSLNTAWAFNLNDTLFINKKFLGKKELIDSLGSFQKIIITNGYTKSDELWKKNARVKSIDVIYNGVYVKTITLIDTFLPQEFDLKIKVPNNSKIALVIKDKYKGTKYDDICLSNLVMNDGHTSGFGFGISIK